MRQILNHFLNCKTPSGICNMHTYACTCKQYVSCCLLFQHYYSSLPTAYSATCQHLYNCFSSQMKPWVVVLAAICPVFFLPKYPRAEMWGKDILKINAMSVLHIVLQQISSKWICIEWFIFLLFLFLSLIYKMTNLKPFFLLLCLESYMTTLFLALCYTNDMKWKTMFFRTNEWNSQRLIKVARGICGPGPRAMLT